MNVGIVIASLSLGVDIPLHVMGVHAICRQPHRVGDDLTARNIKSAQSLEFAEGFELADAILWGLMAQEDVARHRLDVRCARRERTAQRR